MTQLATKQKKNARRKKALPTTTTLQNCRNTAKYYIDFSLSLSDKSYFRVVVSHCIFIYLIKFIIAERNKKLSLSCVHGEGFSICSNNNKKNIMQFNQNFFLFLTEKTKKKTFISLEKKKKKIFNANIFLAAISTFQIIFGAQRTSKLQMEIHTSFNKNRNLSVKEYISYLVRR